MASCSMPMELFGEETPETDVQGAKRFDMPPALVTETGIMADRISKQGLEDALNNLSSNLKPDYYIGQLKDDL